MKIAHEQTIRKYFFPVVALGLAAGAGIPTYDALQQNHQFTQKETRFDLERMKMHGQKEPKEAERLWTWLNGTNAQRLLKDLNIKISLQESDKDEFIDYIKNNTQETRNSVEVAQNGEIDFRILQNLEADIAWLENTRNILTFKNDFETRVNHNYLTEDLYRFEKELSKAKPEEVRGIIYKYIGSDDGSIEFCINLVRVVGHIHNFIFHKLRQHNPDSIIIENNLMKKLHATR